MSHQRLLALLAALTALSMCGCQSMFPPDVVRGQSPGLGGMRGMNRPPQAPRPFDPNQELEPTYLELGWEKLANAFKPNPDKSKAQEAFRQAEALFAEKDYDAASDEYQRAADLAPGSITEEHSMFMIGECHFFSDRYPDAYDAYSELLKKYGSTQHLDRVAQRLFAMGRYWREYHHQNSGYSLAPNFTDRTRPWFDTDGYSLKAFQAVWMNDPTGPLADDSVMQTANTHFSNGRWRDADEYYSQLRKDFPNSKHIVDAFVLGYRAKLEAYQGPGYDPGPLNQAEELIEVLVAQFGDKLDADERRRVQQAKEAIRAQKAERQWAMGEFFARGGHYRGARYYYQQVMKDFPGTPFAELSQEKLKEIAGLPDKPVKRLNWLANLFPSRVNVAKPIGYREGDEDK